MSEKSSAAKGCFGVIAAIFVMACVFAMLSNKSAKAETDTTSQVETTHAAETQAPPAAESSSERPSPDTSGPSSADVAEAEGTVAFIIGFNGYHCIKVIDAQAAGSGVYDVTCITDHHGHRATYMVNSRTNDVAEI
jgi:hypothetical protein